jgi:hypothetical protein
MLTTDFLNQVRRLAAVPNNQARFSPADILAIADAELDSTVKSIVLCSNSDYWTFAEQIIVSASSPLIDVPYRAAGGVLADIKTVEGTKEKTLLRLDQESFTDNETRGFYLQGLQIGFPSSFHATVKLLYPIRPSLLIPVASARAIQSVAGNAVIMSTPNALFTQDTPLDIVDGRTGRIRSIDLLPTSVSSQTVNFSAGVLPSGVRAGDYLCLAGQTCVLPPPDGLIPFLAQLVANQILQSVNAMDAYNVGMGKLKELEKAFRASIMRRVQGEPQTVVASPMFRR